MAAALILLVVILTVAGVLRARYYRRWFRLPARRIDRLGCPGSHQDISILAGSDGFDLPAGIDIAGRTVFIYMTVNSRPLGYLLDPCIEIQLGQRVQRQYFERGAAGGRYLNLTHLLSHQGDDSPRRVHLRGKLFSWQPEAELLIFEPPAIDAASTLVLAPHPDDAEAAAFGMYSCHESCVVTVTAGERATGTMPSFVPSNSRPYWTALLRVADSLIAPPFGQGQTTQRVSLVYPDGMLGSMYRQPECGFQLTCEATLPRARLRMANELPIFQNAGAECRWSNLVADLRQVLQATRPRTIICPHPLLDGHSDHVFTAVALEEALRGFEGEPPLLLLYVIHARDAPLHPLGPADSLVGLPPGRHDQWLTASIYSHPLTPRIQQAKYFALEAMHAARSHPDVEPVTCSKFLAAVKPQMSAWLSGLALHPTSILRRAPRPDEIYFVVGANEFPQLVARTLQNHAVSAVE